MQWVSSRLHRQARCRNVKSVTTTDKKRELTEGEMERLLKAAKGGRHGIRDHALMLLGFRHGMRVSELIDVRLSEVDLDTGRIYVRRKKGSLSTHHVLEGDELRAIRAWLRERSIMRPGATDGPWLFLGERGPLTRQAVNYLVREAGKRAKLPFRVHPHMLRHSCGFALANKGKDTRLIQDFLGHKNIAHTVRYTRTAAKRFEDIWRK